MTKKDYTEIIGVNTNTIPAQNPRKSKDSKAEIQYQENSLLQRAIHFRDFEIKASWERSKYFIIFLGTLFVAYYTMKKNDLTLQQFILPNGYLVKQIPVQVSVFPNWMFLLITGLGTAISFVWYWVNRGSKLIYENWEHHIDCIEEQNVAGNISRVHCYKPFKGTKLLGAYPISPSKANTLVSLLISVAFFMLFVYELYLYLSLCGCNNLIEFIFLFVLVYVVGCTILAKNIHSDSYPQCCNSQDGNDIFARNRLSNIQYRASYDSKKNKRIWIREN